MTNKIVLIVTLMLFGVNSIAQKNSMHLSFGYALAVKDFVDPDLDPGDDGLIEINSRSGFSASLGYQRNIFKGLSFGIKCKYNRQPLAEDVVADIVTMKEQWGLRNNANYTSVLLLSGIVFDLPLTDKFLLKTSFFGGYHNLTISTIKFANPYYVSTISEATAGAFATDFGLGVQFGFSKNMSARLMSNYTFSNPTLPPKIGQYQGAIEYHDSQEIDYAIFSLSLGCSFSF